MTNVQAKRWQEGKLIELISTYLFLIFISVDVYPSLGYSVFLAFGRPLLVAVFVTATFVGFHTFRLWLVMFVIVSSHARYVLFCSSYSCATSVLLTDPKSSG